MKNEESSIEKLKDFASKTHRKINCCEKLHPSNSLHPVSYYRRFISIPENDEKQVFFACFADSRKLDHFFSYSGVFFPIDVATETKICIRKMKVFDKMNLFSKKIHYKTGINAFDSQVVFEDFTAIGTNQIFTNTKIQEVILKVFDFDMRLKVGVNMLNIDFIPELKGKSHIGIYLTNEWYSDFSMIELLFNLAERLKSRVIKLKTV
ncbi:hypothetical protein [Marinifilum sp.]|uniref:hypothetical protein n=1 Tax=Marinifilum sp. TaxID=2033137 RepID=UPI003BA940D7